ncbi:MAG TPA: hypothetical protein GX708_08330 [Gallicola sp.]|nr:hypothetical protein [Gallicola sp.]
MKVEEIYGLIVGLKNTVDCLENDKKESQYIKDEEAGRVAFLDYLLQNKEYRNEITSIKFSDLYSDYDVKITTSTKIQLIEIKKRNLNSSDYSTDLLQLDKCYKMYLDADSIKYLNEAETNDKRKVSYYYYNFFNDNKLIKYKLDYTKIRDSYTINKMMMQHTTSIASEKILKDVVFLDREKESAEIINLN